MDFSWSALFTAEFWQSALNQFGTLSPLVPIAVVAMESLIPALPLIAFVAWNVAAFGAFKGFLYSWIGTCLGCTIVFGFFRLIFGRGRGKIEKKHEKIAKLGEKLRAVSPVLLGLIIALPFTPSSVLNIAFGISGYSAKKYLSTLYIAKIATISLLAIFGHSLVSALKNPLYMIFSILFVILLYFLSKLAWKKIEK